MKKKPLLITIICLAVAFICLFFFVKAKYFRRADTNEITQFVKDFDAELRSGNMDSLRNFFEGGGNAKTSMLIKTLANKTSLGEKSDPDFTTTLDADDVQILMSNSDISVVKVPVIFSHANYDLQKSYITFTIRRIADHQYKFVKVKADRFAKDYMAYKTKINDAFPPDKPVEYSPLTLAAFKTAETLKGKYDSVVWFQHIGSQNYFYVANGSLKGEREDILYQVETDSAKTYKLGLLGPDLKEIIPLQYDLIHNINGTFKDLIEVDKDKKHGFYSIDGKLVVPVEYEQIFPVKDETHLAAMRKGDDYYWLNKDLTISEKADIKIADILSQIKDDLQFKLLPPQKDIMERNSRDFDQSVYISPSYLVDLNILGKAENFKNPLRKNSQGYAEYASTDYNVNLDYLAADNTTNAFTTLLYNIKSHFIGGRADLYEGKSLIVVDRQKNRILSTTIDISGEEGDVPTGCDQSSLHMISDSLFEIKVTASVNIDIPTDTIISEDITEAPVYHYLKIKNNKLEEISTNRTFSFTKFVKMDDSYLKGCYSYLLYSTKNNSRKVYQTDYIKPKFYQYIINEIYADYHYKFKNTKWSDGFQDMGGISGYKPENDNVDDSLTAIDKYNINFLKQKIAGSKANRIAMK